MSLDQLAKLTPNSINPMRDAYGGKSEITYEDVCGALGANTSSIGCARSVTASAYARSIILNQQAELPDFRRKLLMDLVDHWIKRKLEHPKESYLVNMINVAILDLKAGSGKRPNMQTRISAFGCTKNDWYNKHRRVYLQHVLPFALRYETIISDAMRRMNYD